MAFPSPTTYRPPITGSNFMIATGHYLATMAGAKILASGGNAIDAGVCAGFCTNVLQPDMTNIGGVAPAMVYSASDRKVYSVSGLGWWPRATEREYFVEECDGMIPPGVRRCVIPAAVDSWLTSLERWGTMSLEDVLAPAIELARGGFAVYPFLEASLIDAEEGLRRWDSSAATYLPHSRVPRAGEKLRQPDLARTLELLVEAERSHIASGREKAIRAARDRFYKGDIADAIHRFMRSHDGWMTRDDLAEFSVDIEEPPSVLFRGYTIHGCGPWSQGPVLLETLNILDEGIDLQAGGHNSARSLHQILEALKASFADRDRYVADPKFIDVPMQGLLSPEYAKTWRERISRIAAFDGMPEHGDPWQFDERSSDRRQARRPVPFNAPVEPDTSYLCVIDRHGNAFSATPSDGVTGTPLIPDLGFIVSSRGVQSWLDPDHPAAIEPGKRPRLTPNPAMITKDGELVGPFGTPGNDTQPQAMVQLLVNLFDHGMNPQEAVEAPRIATYSFPRTTHPHPYTPNLTYAEARIPDDVVARLRAYGHDVQLWPDLAAPAGSLCTILVDRESGILHGAADPRRLAYAIGW